MYIKYKERAPQETIKIIKEFFEKKGLNIRQEKMIFNPESLTWSIYLRLFYKDTYLMMSWGKGVTKEFALASGYGEMYERFCCKTSLYHSEIFTRDFEKKSYELNGYYYHPNEKILNFDEMFLFHFHLKELISSFEDEPGQFKNALNIYDPNQIPGVEYVNIRGNKSPVYLNPQILKILLGSSGEAAGNTLEEALVQSISEIFEHYCAEQFYKAQNLTFYYLNLDKITNEILKEKIDAIKQHNHLWIFDLSYNFNLPVLASLLVNKENGTVAMNFGAFPVFDIALERVITELYQGVTSYCDHKPGLLAPSRVQPWELNQLYSLSNLTFNIYYNDNIFLNNEIKESYNNKVFLSNNKYSSEELLNYYKNILNDLDLDFYYANRSLSNEIFAIHTVCLNKFYGGFLANVENAKKVKNKKLFYFLKKNNYNFINDLLTSKYCNKDALLTHCNAYLLFNEDQEFNLSAEKKTEFNQNQYFIKSITSGTNFSLFMPFIKNSVELPLAKLLNDDKIYANFITKDLAGTPYHKYAKKYGILMQYINNTNYSKQEILKIFNFLQLGITEEDIDNIKNKDYFINKVFIEPLIEFYYSDHYQQLLTAIVKN